MSSPDPIQGENKLPPIKGAEPPPPIPGISGSSQSDAESPFRKMFGGMMNKKEFTQFINQFMKDMVTQFKQAEARWKKAMERLKKTEEGKD